MKNLYFCIFLAYTRDLWWFLRFIVQKCPLWSMWKSSFFYWMGFWRVKMLWGDGLLFLQFFYFLLSWRVLNLSLFFFLFTMQYPKDMSFILLIIFLKTDFLQPVSTFSSYYHCSDLNIFSVLHRGGLFLKYF